MFIEVTGRGSVGPELVAVSAIARVYPTSHPVGGVVIELLNGSMVHVIGATIELVAKAIDFNLTSHELVTRLRDHIH